MLACWSVVLVVVEVESWVDVVVMMVMMVDVVIVDANRRRRRQNHQSTESRRGPTNRGRVTFVFQLLLVIERVDQERRPA